MAGKLEHVNFTVSDPKRTAELMCALFGWRVRWHGPAMSGGLTYHVGDDDAYLAVYAPPGRPAQSFVKGKPMNHVGVVVDDLDAVEARVREAGYAPFGHDTYEPGRRFYFFDENGIEFEVVSYA
jgi:catechol 2,3-dioxygenase-like lactoylglutathione lyase family enzyme